MLIAAKQLKLRTLNLTCMFPGTDSLGGDNALSRESRERLLVATYFTNSLATFPVLFVITSRRFSSELEKILNDNLSKGFYRRK